jgi:hypothetical protein
MYWLDIGFMWHPHLFRGQVPIFRCLNRQDSELPLLQDRGEPAEAPRAHRAPWWRKENGDVELRNPRNMCDLWMIYGWFMDGFWMIYGWFRDDLYICFFNDYDYYNDYLRGFKRNIWDLAAHVSSQHSHHPVGVSSWPWHVSDFHGICGLQSEDLGEQP